MPNKWLEISDRYKKSNRSQNFKELIFNKYTLIFSVAFVYWERYIEASEFLHNRLLLK